MPAAIIARRRGCRTGQRARLRTGRPLGGAQWLARQEEELGRPLAPRKRGPKPKAAAI